MTESHFWSGGRVFTGRRFHEALLVDDGRVVAVGSETALRPLRPTGVENHPLNGEAIIPGLIDAHLHLGELALEAQGVLLERGTSTAAFIDRARAWGDAHPSGPIVARGWDTGDSLESEWPQRRDLDRIDAGRPVLLYHASGHAVIVNSVALETLGIDRHTPDPPGGRVGRDARDEPNGCLFEAATRRVNGLAHTALASEPGAVGRRLERAAAHGLTAVGTMNAGPEELEAIDALAEEDRLPIRVRAWVGLRGFALMGSRKVAALRSSDGRFGVAGVKAFADGAFGTRTAWLSEPYTDDPSNAGMSVDSLDVMREAFDRARSLGLSPAVHALGDRGLDQALQCLEPPVDHPLARPERVEHAGLVPPALLPKVDRVRPVLVVQPVFVWSDGWLTGRLGNDRARWAYPFRTLLEHGHILAGSSDAPFDAFDPWLGLRAAIHRVGPNGRSANPEREEELTAEMAVSLYTRGGAQALGEPEIGELEPGRRADLVRLHAPSLEQAIEAGVATVRETWVDGARVYCQPSSGSSPQTV